MQTSPVLRRVAFAVLVSCALLLVLGCNSAFRDAMRSGDELAMRGDWDRAAAAYEEATRLDPDDEDARAMLRGARMQQSAIRVVRGYQLLRAGNARDALAPFVEAVRFDPLSPYARQGLEEAKAKVLSDASLALADGRFKEAYDLARTYLLVDPARAEAREIEATARENIAQAAFERGRQLETKGALSLALIDHGEALQFKPLFPEARARVVELRRALREQVTYYVALKNFDGDASSDDLGSDVDAAVLAAGLDPALPLRVVDMLPKGKSYQHQGMRLGGVFRGYAYDKSSSRSTRTCDYICGKELAANPAYASAEASMRTSQSALGTAEGRLSAAKAGVLPAERAQGAAKTAHDQRKAEANRADQDLSRCRSQPGGQPGACSAEEQRRTRAQEDEKLAEQEARRAAQAVDSAKRELQDAESDVVSRRTDAESRKRTFEHTPAKVEIDKHCAHSYAVDTVIVTGEVECQLHGEGLYDTGARLNQAVTGRTTRQDETFTAQAGVCRELAQGDPLTIPSPAEVKKLVLASAVSQAQQAILASFDRYREEHLARGRAAAIDKRDDAAVDAFVRYLLSIGKEDGSEKARQALADIARLKSVDDKAVRIALFGAQP